MSRFKSKDTLIDGVKILDRNLFVDDRGSFSRLFCQQDMTLLQFEASINQVNISKTKEKGTIRGMHFQRGVAAEDKYIVCLKGSVFDVCVDIRPGSAGYLKWDSIVLTATENKMIYIPKGIAHGFQALEDDCWLLYFHTNAYVPSMEAGLNPLDKKLDINWPLPVDLVSQKDLKREML